MNQSDPFPTRAMPRLRSIVLTEVLPTTPCGHFPVPDNVLHPACHCLVLLLSPQYAVGQK